MARTKIRGNSQVIDESIVNGQIAPDAAIGRSKLADGTASRVVINDATGALADSSITSTELDALSGITDNIQDQLDTKISYNGLKFNVIPSGTINGTNKIFTLSSNVFDDTHLLVFLNGVLQKPVDDYDLTDSAEITFVDVPETGDQIVVFYVDDSIAGSGSGSSGGSSFTPFQWSSDEQVWPFEKASDGSTLYCREVDFGALPSSGYKNVSHGISGLTVSKIFNVNMLGLGAYSLPIPLAHADSISYQVGGPWVHATHIEAGNAYNYSSFTATVRLIYKK